MDANVQIGVCRRRRCDRLITKRSGIHERRALRAHHRREDRCGDAFQGLRRQPHPPKTTVRGGAVKMPRWRLRKDLRGRLCAVRSSGCLRSYRCHLTYGRSPPKAEFEPRPCPALTLRRLKFCLKCGHGKLCPTSEQRAGRRLLVRYPRFSRSPPHRRPRHRGAGLSRAHGRRDRSRHAPPGAALRRRPRLFGNGGERRFFRRRARKPDPRAGRGGVSPCRADRRTGARKPCRNGAQGRGRRRRSHRHQYGLSAAPPARR
jgi:hypothetical protein